MEKIKTFNFYWSMQDGYHAQRGNIYLWATKTCYVTAKKTKDNIYYDHINHDSLENALDRLKRIK